MKLKKELKDLGVVGLIFLTLYLTGLHTDVAAFAQRVILETGIVGVSDELPTKEKTKVDYNLILEDLNGNVTNLADHKGKVVFLNLWATWCPPCIAEMPNIQSLHNKVDTAKISFVMLSMDREMSKVERFIDKKGYTFPVYMPKSRMPQAFKTNSIPVTFVISPEGKLVSKHEGMGNYDKKSFIKMLNKYASEVTVGQ